MSDYKTYARNQNVAKIEIIVSGPCGSGKSSVMQSIKECLEGQSYPVVYASRGQRNNPEQNIQNADHHIRPNPDSTVFVLIENTDSGSAVFKMTGD